MELSKSAKEYCSRIFPSGEVPLSGTDPEYLTRFQNFAYDETHCQPLPEGEEPLDERTRYMAILAVLLGCQGIALFPQTLSAALNIGVTPIEVREIVYQGTAYLGLGRVYPFIHAMNEVLTARGIALPLEDQETTTGEDRLEKGNDVQIRYFGENMREKWKDCPSERIHINKWLAANCFGDYYTRKGLTDRQREMITFCFIYAQGGCEPQLRGHTFGNLSLGATKTFLYQVVSSCIPYVGYPRSLNALAIIDEVTSQFGSP